MSDPAHPAPEQRILAAIREAARTLGAPAEFEPMLERPRDPSFGDWATNAAMLLARPLGRKPRDIAQELLDSADFRAAGVASASIAGPGFINLRLDPAAQNVQL